MMEHNICHTHPTFSGWLLDLNVSIYNDSVGLHCWSVVMGDVAELSCIKRKQEG